MNNTHVLLLVALRSEQNERRTQIFKPLQRQVLTLMQEFGYSLEEVELYKECARFFNRFHARCLDYPPARVIVLCSRFVTLIPRSRFDTEFIEGVRRMIGGTNLEGDMHTLFELTASKRYRFLVGVLKILNDARIQLMSLLQVEYERVLKVKRFTEKLQRSLCYLSDTKVLLSVDRDLFGEFIFLCSEVHADLVVRGIDSVSGFYAAISRLSKHVQQLLDSRVGSHESRDRIICDVWSQVVK